MGGLWARLVRFGFRLLYNELAFTYDLVSKLVSLGAWRCWQRAALDHLGDGPILELAQGTGNLQLDLYAAGHQPVGVDLSEAMLRIAARKLRRRGIQPRLMGARVQALPFADACFGTVVATFPTEYIVDPAVLAEIRRVLRADGRLVVVLNGLFTARGPVVSFLEWLYRITGQRADRAHAPTQYTVEALTRTYAGYLDHLAAQGFRARVAVGTCQRSVAVLVVAQSIS